MTLPRLFLSASALLSAAMLVNGCASAQNDLTLSSQASSKSFTQTFDKAYASSNDNGDYDIVMIHDANADPVADNGSGPLVSAVAPPRQVVHIRVYWTPIKGTMADHPAATNAMVRWYMFGDRPDETHDMLEYAGSGLVKVTKDGGEAAVQISGAFLSPVARRGRMADPLGNSSLNGTITAKVDRGMVKDVLAEVSAAQPVAGPQASAR